MFPSSVLLILLSLTFCQFSLSANVFFSILFFFISPWPSITIFFCPFHWICSWLDHLYSQFYLRVIYFIESKHFPAMKWISREIFYYKKVEERKIYSPLQNNNRDNISYRPVQPIIISEPILQQIIKKVFLYNRTSQLIRSTSAILDQFKTESSLVMSSFF